VEREVEKRREGRRREVEKMREESEREGERERVFNDHQKKQEEKIARGRYRCSRCGALKVTLTLTLTD
jgi:hypothetical protein